VANRWHYPVLQALQRHTGCRLPNPPAQTGLSARTADPAAVPTIETAGLSQEGGDELKKQPEASFAVKEAQLV
jgi:hypothetical protein